MAKTTIEPSKVWDEILPGVRLFREDIEELHRIAGDGAKYGVQNFLYDTIDELRIDHGDSLKSLLIESADENFKLRIDYGASIRVRKDASQFFNAKELLTRRMRFGARHSRTILAVLFVLNILAGVIIQFVVKDLELSFLIIIFMLALWMPISYPLFSQTRWNRISTLRRHEHRTTSIWEKSKDKIVSGIVVGTVMLIVGFVAGQFADEIKQLFNRKAAIPTATTPTATTEKKAGD